MRFAAFVLLLALVPRHAFACETESPVRLTIPSVGSIEFAVPTCWKAEVGVIDRYDPPPPMLHFTEREGPSFHVQLAVLTPQTSETGGMSNEAMLGLLKQSADQYKAAHFATTEVADFIEHQEGAYFFVATDPAPKPDEWEYSTHAAVRIFGSIVVIDALTNDGQEEILQRVRAMLASASVIPSN